MEQSLEKYTHCNWTLQCTATTHWYTLHRTATNHSAQYRVESRKMHISQSRSEPDSKQKTETELTFWYVFPYFVHSEPWWWLLLLPLLEKSCSNCVWNSLFFSYLASMSGVVCVVCPFADDEKQKNIHVNLALLVWVPTLLSTHAPLTP